MANWPDLLIFKREDVGHRNIDVPKAIAAIEVRSSSFLAEKYARFMEGRTATAIAECERLTREILTGSLANILKEKAPAIFDLLQSAKPETFQELDFRARTWSSSDDLRRLSDLLWQIKEHISILHKRDYLSITPKLEDIALVNRWIQRFNVRHYYLQVFFHKAYVIPFKKILEISSDSTKEGSVFSVEQDVKNQRKTTIKINVHVGSEVHRKN